MGQRTEGDLVAEAYFSERSQFIVSEHEPDLGIGVRPEYVITCGGIDAVTEVKEFAWESWPIKGSGTYSMEQMLKPIRGQLHNAARKLRSAVVLSKPLVVVLTDPKGVMASRLGPMEVISAIMGDVSIQIPVSASGATGPASMIAGRNGEFTNDHGYVSAVLVVHNQSGAPQHIGHWFITNSAQAVPLPEGFYTGASDYVWEFMENEGYCARDDLSIGA